jgi:hypothetical protein
MAGGIIRGCRPYLKKVLIGDRQLTIVVSAARRCSMSKSRRRRNNKGRPSSGTARPMAERSQEAVAKTAGDYFGSRRCLSKIKPRHDLYSFVI